MRELIDLHWRPAAVWSWHDLRMLNSVIADGIRQGANAMDACPHCGQWHLCTGHNS